MPGRRSLRGKVTVLALSATLVTAALVGSLSITVIRRNERVAAEQYLGAVARIYSERIGVVFHLMERDARILASTPPITGLIRTDRAPDRRDPLDGSPDEVWRTRLAQVFTGLLEAQPHYTQVRYIGRSNDWTELVRVDRSPGEIRRVSDRGLQTKGAEPYLTQLTEASGPDGHFSEVTLNREFGIEAGPPTIRFVQPVFDEQGALFGAVVINADYEKLLQSAAPDVSGAFRVAVLNRHSDYVAWAEGTTPRLNFHLGSDWIPPEQAGFPGGDAGALTLTDDTAVYAVRVLPLDHTLMGELTVRAAIPKSALFASSREVLLTKLLSGVFATIFVGIAAGALGSRITRPLRDLHAAICNRPDNLAEMPALPHSRDEVGQLAGSFQEMANDLIRQTAATRMIFDGAADGFVTIDENGRIQEVNRATEAIFDYPATDLVGEPVTMLMPEGMARSHQTHVNRASVGAEQRKMAANRDIYGRRRDGSEVPLEISVSRAVIGEEVRFIAVLRDVTERKAGDARVDSLVAALRKSNDELDKFAYVASHDLKAPLRVIENTSRWLEEDLQEYLTDDTRESMEMLRGRVARMDRLLDDLLQHSRIGRVRENSMEVTGAELVAALRELIEIPDGIRLEVGPGFADIRLPRTPIQAVLLNLVGNAVKHHDRPEGMVRLDVTAGPDRFEFTVEDDGPGIPPRYHDKVFEIFQTLKPRDVIDGSGMGLAMVKKHAEVAGGTIAIQSDGTRGTRMHLVWPRKDNSQNEEHAA